MIAVDTNLLVYAHRKDSTFHVAAARCIRELAEGRSSWAIPWPCLHEFFSVVTHARIYAPPSTAAQALAQVDSWLASPSLVLLGEGVDHWSVIVSLVRAGHVSGPRIHEARIAAICAQHGVRELFTFDRDFSRFPQLRTRNPLAT